MIKDYTFAIIYYIIMTNIILYHSLEKTLNFTIDYTLSIYYCTGWVIWAIHLAITLFLYIIIALIFSRT